MNEELMQKNDALSEKELDGVSGGAYIVDAAAKLGAPVIACPACESLNVAPDPEGGYRCLECKVKFGQGQDQTRKIPFP